jgi:hypothetical protein
MVASRVARGTLFLFVLLLRNQKDDNLLLSLWAGGEHTRSTRTYCTAQTLQLGRGLEATNMGHSLRSTSAVTLVVFLALVVSSSAARVISDKRQSLFQLARGKFSATLGLAPSSSSDDGGGAPMPAPPPWFCHGIDCPQVYLDT